VHYRARISVSLYSFTPCSSLNHDLSTGLYHRSVINCDMLCIAKMVAEMASVSSGSDFVGVDLTPNSVTMEFRPETGIHSRFAHRTVEFRTRAEPKIACCDINCIQASAISCNSESQATVMQQTTKFGSPYCSDPNCKYCNELREVHKKVKKGEWIPSKAAPSTQTKSQSLSNHC
jgi:hypothetical protein